MSVRKPSRGEVWMTNLDPTVGHEQAGTRPELVISVDPFNHGASGLVIVVPITSKDKKIGSHVPTEPPEGGLDLPSFIKCEDIRSVSTARLSLRRGLVGEATLAAVEDRLKLLMGL
jgi:mRNA interferase MazF